MADTTNKLPEGTDTTIEPAATGTTRATGGATSLTATDRSTDALVTTDEDTGSTSGGGIRGMISNVSTKARDEAAGRARGFVGDTLKSGSTTLGNISSLIGDTVAQIEEKLGPQYAGYARTASDTVQRYATTLENKNPDELVDDARDLVRKSPAVALAGAAILGFGLVRLLKAGMPEEGTRRDGTKN
ncbi:hypothetical protein GCM10022281_20750 [Sphingomonas rosea]|uniref:Uncharacterized protein n=1 Tax=Sphingomonas rosea TaxID=335605 RepID=A0ABP7UBF3_9SPHN